MHKHLKRSESQPAGSTGGRGLVVRAGGTLIGGALVLAVVAATAVASSPPPTVAPSATMAPRETRAPLAATGTDSIPAATGTTSADEASSMALDRVFAVLERAERAATESGRTTTPQIQQAAGELGMLLSSYLATHPDAAAHARAAPTGAVAPLLRTGAVTPTLHKLPLLADEPGAEPVESDAPAPISSAAPSGLPAPAGEDVTAPGKRAAAPGKRAAAPDERPTTPDEAASSPDEQVPADVVEDDEVTFADVWAATLRLAALLDPAQSPEAPAAPAPATGDAGTPLTESLREVVARWGDSTDGYLNGRIPASVLCTLDFAPGQRLRCDAAAQLEDLNAAYRAQFGTDIPVTDSYRPYDAQVRVKAQKGWLAATPGYSNHGWGLAVDLGTPIDTGSSAQYLWLRLHGPDHGWDNPTWARLDGSKPEPWHFEFFAAGPMPNRALSAADVALWQADRADSSPEPVPDEVPPTVPPTTVAPAPEPSPVAGPRPSPTSSTGPAPEPSGEPTPTPTASDPAEATPEPSPSGPTPTDPATVVVPDVTGLSADDALTALAAVGLVRVSVSEQPVSDDTVAAGLVAATTPTAGSDTSPDTVIVLVLSSGPDPAPSPSPTPAPSDDSTPAPSSTGPSQLRRAARGRDGDT